MHNLKLCKQMNKIPLCIQHKNKNMTIKKVNDFYYDKKVIATSRSCQDHWQPFCNSLMELLNSLA